MTKKPAIIEKSPVNGKLHRLKIDGNPKIGSYSYGNLTCSTCYWQLSVSQTKSGSYLTPTREQKWRKHVAVYDALYGEGSDEPVLWVGDWESARLKGSYLVYHINTLPGDVKTRWGSDAIKDINEQRQTCKRLSRNKSAWFSWYYSSPWIVVYTKGGKKDPARKTILYGFTPSRDEALVLASNGLLKHRMQGHTVTIVDEQNLIGTGVAVPLPAIEDYVADLIERANSSTAEGLASVLKEVQGTLTQFELVQVLEQHIIERLLENK